MHKHILSFSASPKMRRVLLFLWCSSLSVFAEQLQLADIITEKLLHRIVSLEKAVSKIQEERADEVRALHDTMAVLQANLSRVNDETAVRDDLDRCNDKLKQLEDKVKAKNAGYDELFLSLSLENEQKSRVLNSHTRSIGAIDQYLDAIESDISTQKDRFAEELSDIVEEVDTFNATWKTKIERQREALTLLRLEHKQRDEILNNHTKSLRTIDELLETFKSGLSNKTETLERKVDGINAQIEGRDNLLTALMRNNSRIRSLNGDLSERSRTFERELRILVGRFDAFDGDLTDQSRNLEAIIDKINRLNLTLEGKIVRANHILTSLTRNSEFEAFRSDISNRAQDLERNVDKMIEGINTLNETLKTSLESYDAAVKSLHQNNILNNGLLADVSSSLRTTNQQILSLSATNNATLTGFDEKLSALNGALGIQKQKLKYLYATLKVFEVGLKGSECPNKGNVVVSLADDLEAPICSDGLEDSDAMNIANVACKQTGHSAALNFTRSTYFGSASSNVAFDEVRCSGNETNIGGCDYKMTDKSCRLNQGLGIICTTDDERCTKLGFQVRLEGSDCPNKGNVIVTREDGFQGPVCDDGLEASNGFEKARSMNVANVVCKQLGYSKALNYTFKSYFGEVNSDFALDNVNCDGNEEGDIGYCRKIFNDNCGSTEGFGVVCQTEDRRCAKIGYQVRLEGSECPNKGDVMITRDDGFQGHMCDDNLNGNSGMNMAKVVCKQLGFSDALNYTTNSNFGTADVNFAMGNVLCSGSEINIGLCFNSINKTCRSGKSAGVICLSDEQC